MSSIPTIGVYEDAILMVPPVVPTAVSPVFPEVSLVPPVPCTDNGSSIVDITKNKVKAVRENLDNTVIRDRVSNKLCEKIILDEQKYLYDISGINFFDELEKFLAIRNSSATKTGYKYSVQQFVQWCHNNDVNLLGVRVSDVDRYQSFLIDSGFSNKTIRTRILGVSSFYTFLLHRYPKVLKVNPFTHRNLPRDICKNPKDYITDTDVKALRKEFSRIGRQDMVCVIDLLSKYGFRVGCFSTLHIDKNGRYSFLSKGSEYSGQFTKTEHQRIIKYGVQDLTVSTIRNIIKKYVKKLYKSGGVSCNFSVHDIRRYVINKHADKCGDFRKFLNFSRSIHKNINTTIGYVS
jgi:site-specific recombinase XerD